MDQLSKRLAETLKNARLARGYTQAELAELAGLASEAYGRLERGAVMPKASTLRELALALDVTADQLLGLEEREAGQMPSPDVQRLLRGRWA